MFLRVPTLFAKDGSPPCTFSSSSLMSVPQPPIVHCLLNLLDDHTCPLRSQMTTADLFMFRLSCKLTFDRVKHPTIPRSRAYLLVVVEQVHVQDYCIVKKFHRGMAQWCKGANCPMPPRTLGLLPGVTIGDSFVPRVTNGINFFSGALSSGNTQLACDAFDKWHSDFTYLFYFDYALMSGNLEAIRHVVDSLHDNTFVCDLAAYAGEAAFKCALSLGLRSTDHAVNCALIGGHLALANKIAEGCCYPSYRVKPLGSDLLTGPIHILEEACKLGVGKEPPVWWEVEKLTAASLDCLLRNGYLKNRTVEEIVLNSEPGELADVLVKHGFPRPAVNVPVYVNELVRPRPPEFRDICDRVMHMRRITICE